MNLIGLDISKISTAMAIESNGKEYIFSYNNKKLSNKWNDNIKHICNIKTYEYINSDDYSISEIEKLKQFINIANDVLKDILETININDESIIYIEGYSYSKDPGPIIDLVGIASIIRAKIFEYVPNIKEIKIISPKSLKTFSCEIAYGSSMIESGKRIIKIEKVLNTNNNGVKGGDFNKHDMCQAIIDSKIKCILTDYINDNYEEIMGMKTFPKPIEDIDDAWWLKESIKLNQTI